MKISWMPNPLSTIVELDDGDRWALREALQSDHDDADLKWLNTLHEDLVVSLRETHAGDCICIPCACLKCQAEDYLGINTTPGLDKHLGHKVNAAFGRVGERALDEAIAALGRWEPKCTWPEEQRPLWESCLPRWQDEARRAHAWLMSYRDTHFPITRGAQ